MDNPTSIIDEIKQFIEEYMTHSQKRGEMYGSIEMLESNWILLNHLYFIVNGLSDHEEQNSFREFLIVKGFGSKNAAMIIREQNLESPYLELNNIWTEYSEWRDNRIKAHVM